MRVGTSLKSAYIVDDVRLGARWMVEQAVAAREAGLDSLFVGDHHNVPVPYYQNVAVLGRLLAEWDERPAGALLLLPLWHPVLAAEQLGTLAALAGGRFILQCAVGGGEEQFRAFGLTERGRVARFEAALDIIRRLLAGEEVTTPAESPFPIDRVRIAPVTPQPLEVWIGGHAPAAVDRAARLGDGWLAGPEATPDALRSLVASYLEACERHGRTPTAVAVRRDVHVGADHDDAWRVAGPVLERGYRGFDPAACVVGSVEEVAATFAGYAEMGVTDVVVRHLVDDQAEVLASFARLADVRSAVAGR